MFFSKYTKSFFVLIFVLISLLSCSQNDNPDVLVDKSFDKTTGLSKEEFATMLSSSEARKESAEKRKAENQQKVADEYTKKHGEEPPIPDLAHILITPKLQGLGNGKLISLSVTEDVPLKNVIMEIARLADVEMRVDSKIEGGVIFSVKNRTFEDVMERLAQMADLKYEIDDGIVSVKRDLPYVKGYSVDFINLVRSNSSGMDINTKTGSTSSSGDVSSGSKSSTSSKYEGDLWKEIEENLSKLLNISATQTSASATDTENAARKFYTINKQAGLIRVSASGKEHDIIKKYLDALKYSVSSQVIIEAKLVEVSLNDDYRTGIDWNVGTLTGVDTTRGTVDADFSDIFDSTQTPISIGILDTGLDLNASIKLLKEFGTSRTIASPRINAMNNQQAMLTFVTNEVYFDIDLETEDEEDSSGNDTTTITVESEIKTIPVGIILNLQPSIDMDKQEITMNIRPTISKISKYENDPGVALIAGTYGLDIQNKVPVTEVKEIDSILKIKSGQVMVIGGLMEEKEVNKDGGMPFLGSIPLFGNLFKSVQKTKETVETVIFIKATIVPTSGVEEADKEFYRTFVKEPRPLTF